MAVCVLKSDGRSEEPWWCNDDDDDDDDDEDGKNKSTTTQITRSNVSYKTSLFVSTLLEEIFAQI